METQNQPESISRRQEVIKRTGLSYSTIWRMVKAGEFPAPVKLNDTGRGIGWLNSEIDAYLRNRPRAA